MTSARQGPVLIGFDGSDIGLGRLQVERTAANQGRVAGKSVAVDIEETTGRNCRRRNDAAFQEEIEIAAGIDGFAGDDGRDGCRRAADVGGEQRRGDV